MALTIRNAEVEELVEALVRLTGETKTARECAALPVLDDRSADEILGHDARGVPP